MESSLAQILCPVNSVDEGTSARRNIYDYNRLRLIESGLIETVKRSQEKERRLVFFLVKVVKYHYAYPLSHDDVVRCLLQIFEADRSNPLCNVCRNAKVLAQESLWDDDFLLILEVEKETADVFYKSQETIPLIDINKKLNKELNRSAGNAISVYMGYSCMDTGADYFQVKFYDAVRKALRMVHYYKNLQSVYLPSELKSLIRESSFHSLYQPVLSLRTGHVVGWEALIRGPVDTYFHEPGTIFSFAEEIGLLNELEKVCWKTALKNGGNLESHQKLFLNVHPGSCENSNFLSDDVFGLVADAGIKPQKIVIEITERHDIMDMSHFKEAIRTCRDQGFLIALDDVGSGFSCLKSIAEIKPDFIKLSMSLVKGVHKNRAKYILMETFTTLAEKIGCTLIAEGIEDEEDLKSLVNIGVHCGQGYFFNLPAYPRPVPAEEINKKTIHLIGSSPNRLLKYPMVMTEVAEPAVTIDENMKIRDVKTYFDKNLDIHGVVVQGDGMPKGLVMRYQLDRLLGSLSGLCLYYGTIAKIMDKEPLMVDEQMSIDTVSQIAMNRDKMKLYDYIIVMSGREMKGVVSIQKILDTMTKVRLEMAKGANPLTGLPGNLSFERELTQRRSNGKKSSFIFADLDHFKSFNDKYGFERGDKVLLFTADLLKNVLRKYGSWDDFIGHIGGDDFYLFTEQAKADDICRRITRYFDRLIKSYYDEEDQRAGKVIGTDRDGTEKVFPFISISLAIVDVENGASFDMNKMSEQVVQLKRYAKSIPGSVCVRERRSDM